MRRHNEVALQRDIEALLVAWKQVWVCEREREKICVCVRESERKIE